MDFFNYFIFIVYKIINSYYVFGLLVIFLLYAGKKINYFYFSRHQRNIRSARKVIKKIQAWENARIFLYLRKIDPFVFEELLLECFKNQKE